MAGYLTSFTLPALSYILITYRKEVLIPERESLLMSPDDETTIQVKSRPDFFSQKQILAAIGLIFIATVMSIIGLYVTIQKHFIQS